MSERKNILKKQKDFGCSKKVPRDKYNPKKDCHSSRIKNKFLVSRAEILFYCRRNYLAYERAQRFFSSVMMRLRPISLFKKPSK